MGQPVTEQTPLGKSLRLHPEAGATSDGAKKTETLTPSLHHTLCPDLVPLTESHRGHDCHSNSLPGLMGTWTREPENNYRKCKIHQLFPK